MLATSPAQWFHRQEQYGVLLTQSGARLYRSANAVTRVSEHHSTLRVPPCSLFDQQGRRSGCPLLDLGHSKVMAYSILRFGKLKTASQINASQSHCTRTRETKNADPISTPLNRQLLGSAEGLWAQVESLLQVAASKRKTRPDANLACEVLLSASPEWFRQGQDRQRDIDPAQVEQFASHATDFLTTAFGACCLSAVLHLDEMTPHIHAHVVPLHPVKGWLSWEYWFGGREKLQAWHDHFAECMAPLGL